MHRSLDHVIGVRIPASQPIKPFTGNNLRCSKRRRRTVRKTTLLGRVRITATFVFSVNCTRRRINTTFALRSLRQA